MPQKKILFIVPYTCLYPPTNGGMLRNFHLCNELASFADVTLFSLQPAEQILAAESEFSIHPKLKIVGPARKSKHTVFSKYVDALRSRIYQRNLFHSADPLVLSGYPVIKQLLKSNRYDAVIISHATTCRILPLLRKYLHGAKVIVDAHNVDHLLFQKEYDISDPAKRKEFEYLKSTEYNLHKVAAFFSACSEYDKQMLEQINQHQITGFVIPNGTVTRNREWLNQERLGNTSLLFCGSLDYPPNIKALLWFYDEVWPLLLATGFRIDFKIIGRNATSPELDVLKRDPFINFIGAVDTVAPHYHSSNIAIVPLQLGSGTRLKILEAMSFGNPVVSTTAGAEGIDYLDRENILIADDPQSFAAAILELWNKPAEALRIARNAQELVVEKYSWTTIAKGLSKVIEQIGEKS